MNRIALYLSNAIDVRSSEIRALVWAFLYFFFLLAAYYILRPLRDEMGVAAGRENLQWLFTATFFAMLAASPVYSWATTKLPRARLIPWIYHFFAINLVVFWALLWSGYERSLVAKIFFVWVSVFVLFAVSVFWTFMADLFRSEQGKRLFGFIAAGGTAGTIVGSGLVAFGFSRITGVPGLLLVAALLLEIAVLCAMRLERSTREFSSGEARPGVPVADKPAEAIKGGIFDGVALLLKSPYLAGIGAWVALLSLASTFIYFIQQDVVRNASTDPATRTQIFAIMDFGGNIFTLLLQIFATGELIKRLGPGRAAAMLPLVFALGFLGTAALPALGVIIAFQVMQRVTNFGFSNPARELMFTVVAREEKYKAKNLIDTAILRGGDVVWSWAFTGLLALGLSMPMVALTAVPVALGWVALSLWLGRNQEARAASQSSNAQQGGNT
jgi:AAA family ATP:ADP antiporter